MSHRSPQKVIESYKLVDSIKLINHSAKPKKKRMKTKNALQMDSNSRLTALPSNIVEWFCKSVLWFCDENALIDLQLPKTIHRLKYRRQKRWTEYMKPNKSSTSMLTHRTVHKLRLRWKWWQPDIRTEFASRMAICLNKRNQNWLPSELYFT